MLLFAFLKGHFAMLLKSNTQLSSKCLLGELTGVFFFDFLNVLDQNYYAVNGKILKIYINA